MENLSSESIKKLLIRRGLSPKKYLGQNFLIDKEVLEKIIRASEIKNTDIVLEIGPGLGVLTRELAKKAKKVIAVEKDKELADFLKKEFKNTSNVEIIQGDILKIKNGLMVKWLNGYKIVANLPYYATSPIIRKFLESENPPSEMVIMVQKEVGERICPTCRQAGAKPPRMNLLAACVQFYAKPEILFYVSKNSFWPEPKVDSAVIKISRIRTNLLQINTNLFFKIVKAGFSQPRKKLVNNLSTGLRKNKEEIKDLLRKAGISPDCRAQNLTVNDWLNLAAYSVKHKTRIL